MLWLRPILFHHGVRLRCRCDFQLVDFYPYFEMSCCGGPLFPCCRWWVGYAYDRWWLFSLSLLWLLCLSHMCFDLPCCFSGLYLSSGGVGVFGWIWRLVWFALGSGGVWSFVLRNLVLFLLPSWVWKLVFAIRMTWFEVELVICIGLRGSWWFIMYIVYFVFFLHFLHSHLSHFASLVILACIFSIMLINVLGWVVMRCEPFC
jgi:hypothetical protein